MRGVYVELRNCFFFLLTLAGVHIVMHGHGFESCCSHLNFMILFLARFFMSKTGIAANL